MSGSALNLLVIWHWCFISFPFCHYQFFVSLAGAFVGCALNGSVVSTRDSVNARFYGGPIKASEILLGSLPKPPAAATLYKALSVLFDKINKWILPKKKVNLLSVFRFWHSLVHWIISGSLICPLYLIHIPMMQVYTWPSIVLHQTDVFGTTNHSVNAVNMVRILVRNEKKSICSSAIKVNSESTCIISFLEMRCC